MDPPSMDTVYQAINALYNNPNASDKEKASIWLGDVQKSIHSWKIADNILQEKKDVQSCYFAAQTMRSKVQHNLSELPSEAIVSLRDSLIQHLEGVSPETCAAILTQLSLALADLALQMPTWQSIVNDLIKSFSNKNDYALLEILTVLPQEIDSSNLKLGENRREEIKNDLRANAQLVTHFLKESITSSQSTHIGLKIVKCMTSWIQVKAINIADVPQNAVIGYCLQVLREFHSVDALHDAASDCICALLHCLEENNNNDNVERLLFDSVVMLEESYHMAVAHEEEEKAANYARVFTELAETFLEKVVIGASCGNPHFAMRSLELCLVCVGHHDYEVAEITFNLWYRLSEEVYQRDYQALTDTFKPHVERLLEALARHCQYEPDYTQLPEEGDEFYEFRTKVMELIKDVVFIVGSSSVFRQMFASLQGEMRWEQTEAALFVMQAVAKNILPEEYEYVPKVVEAILSMPSDAHPAVRKTCIQLLGELGEWMSQHAACIPPCLQVLYAALQEPDLQLVAALALQNITHTCSASLNTEWVSVLTAWRTCPSPRAPAAAALARALAHAVTALSAAQLAEAMRECVSVLLKTLSELVKSPSVEVKKNSSNDPVVYLDQLAAMFRSVEPKVTGEEHPCLPAFSDSWSVVRDVMDKYQTNSRVMERSCRAVRFMVRCTGVHCARLLPTLADSLARLYTSTAHSCLLYLASVLVDELATEESCISVLIGLLQTLMPRAFSLLSQPNALKENPDTVDDLFRLCIRFLQRIPLQLLSSDATVAALQAALLAARLDHRDANSSVMKFLYDLVRNANCSRPDKQQIKGLADGIVSRYGEELTYVLLEASVLHLHPYMLSEVADVILELIVWQKAANVDWFLTAVQRLPQDVPASATREQCWHFHQLIVRAEKVKEVTRLLRDFAKLYR